MDANPLENMENATKRVGVMYRGRWLLEGELQSRLEALAKSVRDAEGKPEATVSKAQGGQ